MKEFYQDENPPQQEEIDSDWGSSGGGGGGGMGWGWGGGSGGGSGSTPTPEWQKSDDEEITAVTDELRLRATAGGRLMVNEDGKLIVCCQLCETVAAMMIYLKRQAGVTGEDDAESLESEHAQCIQCNLVYTNLNPLLNIPERTLAYDLWPVDRNTEDAPEETAEEDIPRYVGDFPLPDPGETLTVKLKWQSGHYDIAELSRMKIKLFGQSSPWETIPKGNWKEVATITVNDTRQIFVNHISAKLAGNK